MQAAHAGVSLSEAEASIAAPFTSKVINFHHLSAIEGLSTQIADISCVPEVIREGRAALVTSFGIFKYMAAYSLTEFTSIMQLYWLGTNLTDMQVVYLSHILKNTEACSSSTSIYSSLPQLLCSSAIHQVHRLATEKRRVGQEEGLDCSS